MLADDPKLNCRVVQLAGTALVDDASRLPFKQPHRIVLDPQLDIPEDAHLLEGLDKVPLTIFYNPSLTKQAPTANNRPGQSRTSQINPSQITPSQTLADKAARLKARGAILRPTAGQRAAWSEVLDYLKESNLASLFVEGGRQVLASVLEEGFADALILTLGSRIQGGATSWYPKEAPRGFTLVSVLRAGDDLILEYVPSGRLPPFNLDSPTTATTSTTRPIPSYLDNSDAEQPTERLPKAPYRSLNLLAAELGIPGLDPLVPLATASRLFLKDAPGAANGAVEDLDKFPVADVRQTETLTCRQLVFTAPGAVGLRHLRLNPQADEVVVESRLIGISAGTELAVFRGDCLDFSGESLTGLQATAYPLAYGYINVGQTQDGSRVFGFAAHQDRFYAKLGELIQLGGLSWDDAVFLPSMETALSIVHDAHPRLGDRYCVAGQGIVGLLVTRILVSMGVGVISLETNPFRRRISREAGALPFDPTEPGLGTDIASLTNGQGWDCAINCSGSETALQQLINLAPMDSTIVEASWYADRTVSLNLGQSFHRKRLRIKSSQVSYLGSTIGSSWTKTRRFKVVLDLLDRIRPASYISHRFSMDMAAGAYAVLSSPEAEVLQVVIDPRL